MSLIDAGVEDGALEGVVGDDGTMPAAPTGADSHVENTGQQAEPEQTEEPDPIDYKNIKGGEGKARLAKQDLKDIAEDLKVLIRDGSQARRSGGRDSNINKWRNIFEARFSAKGPAFEGATTIIPTDIRTAVETKVGRWREAIFRTNRYVRLVPYMGFDAGVARRLEDFFHKEMNLLTFPEKLTRALTDAAIDGGKVGVTGWVRRQEKLRRRLEINPNTIKMMQEEGVNIQAGTDPAFPVVTVGKNKYRMGQKVLFEGARTTENHFGIEYANVQDFGMFPATSPDLESAGLSWYFFGQSLNDAKIAAWNGYYDKKAVDLLEDNNPRAMGSSGDDLDTGTLGGLIDRDDSQGVNRQNEGVLDRYGSLRFVNCMWNGWDCDGDGITEWVQLIFEWSTGTIVRFQRNPYHNDKIPFDMLSPEPAVGGSFYGYSQIEKGENLHLELTTLTRMGIDLAMLASIVYIVMDRGSRTKPSDLPVEAGPNFLDSVEDGDIKSFHQMPQMQNNMYPDREGVRQQMQRTFGVDDNAQGGPSGTDAVGVANQRATAMAIRERMQLVFILRHITWVANQFFDYCRQYMEDGAENSLRHNGREAIYEVSLADLSAPYYVEAYCADLDPDVAMRKQLIEKIFTAIAQAPFVQSDMVRLWRILEFYVREMGMDMDLTPYIGSEAEAEKMQATQASQAKAQLAALITQQGGKPTGNINEDVLSAITLMGQRPQEPAPVGAPQGG